MPDPVEISPKVRPAHVAVAGGITPLIAQALVYFSNWPLKPLDNDTALSIAGLLVAGGAMVIAMLRKRGTIS